MPEKAGTKRNMPKLQLICLGCVRNLVDSEVMLHLVQKEGFLITPDLQEADYVVVNTCGFLKAERKAAFAVLKDVFKRKRPKAKVIAAGCMTKLFYHELKKKFPNIFFYLGPGNVEEILQALKSPEKGSFVTEKSYLNSAETGRLLATFPHYAYLKISEGCLKQCSYCLIPVIKGGLKSRKIEDIKNEFEKLLDRGVFEINLIAQDLGDYGRDIYGRKALKQLLAELLKTNKKFWLRLLYLYPEEVDEELLKIMQDQRIVPYVDMPIQHINDKILRLMKRSTCKEQILQVIGLLREKLPQITIRTTLMTGFPGEGEKEFLELLQFVKTAKLDHIGFFAFSPEKQTAAYQLPGKVDPKTKKKRVQILAEAQYGNAVEKNRLLIGKRVKAIVESFHPDSKKLLQARFYAQAPEVDPVIILNDFRKVKAFGKMHEVEITDFAGYDLVGRVVR